MTVAEKQSGASTRKVRDMRVGTVVSDCGEKTITVLFQYKIKHPMYGKYVRRSTRLRTHDERNEAKVGDLVEVMSCRPMSKTKRWRLTRILRSVS